MLGEANKAFELLKQFQSNFPLDNLPNMTLDEYTNLKDEKKYFTYLVEFELKSLGEFGGGDAGTRFGIYRTNKKPKKDYNYDGAYAWQKELGNSADEAFNKIKDEILKIAHFSKNNELSKIDDLTLWFFGFKWKIALLYQNPENMKRF